MSEGPGWEITARSFPTNIAPSGKGTIELEIVNVGKASTTGLITVTDALPEGMTATAAGELEGITGGEAIVTGELWKCSGNGPGAAVLGATVVTCTNQPSGFAFAGGAGTPGVAETPRLPNHQPEIGIAVEAGASEADGSNRATIAGGGALGSASTTTAVKVSATPPEFGLTGWDGWFSNEDGTPDTQAGSHPYEATFSFDLASIMKGERLVSAGGEVKNLIVDLPPGFVGNPNAVPQCTRQQLDNVSCPNASQIGFALAVIAGGEGQLVDRVYNMVPPKGVPAEFGLITVEGLNNYLDASVRSGSDYGITTTIANLPTGREIVHVFTTVWGVPADPSHVIWRDSTQGGCTRQQIEQISSSTQEEQVCKPVGLAPKPFLTLPTACGAPQTFTIRADSWQHPDIWSKAEFKSHDSNGNPTGFTGCEKLFFAPTIAAFPDSSNADTPTGLTVDVTPPLGGLENPEGAGTSDIEGTTVTLPPGLVINPGQAAGLQACQPGQDGLTTPAEAAEGKEDSGPPSCPVASKVGTVKAKSPLLEGAAEKELEGNVYVMQSNPPNLKLLAAFSADGVNIKLVLNAHLDEATGQITTTVANVPEFPVSDFKLSFSGGPQAALDTPIQCATYTTTADFTPWSSPFVADAFPTSAMGITAGPGSGPCPSSPLPFHPELIAGATTDQAGGFTDFSLLLQRGDGQQRISGLRFDAPAGLTGELSKVPLCTNAQAESNTCPEASKIGHTLVESGPGPYPLVVPEPGQEAAPIYLTESYGGAPFGLSIVVPLHVGPFVLPTQRVRAKIEVNPTTAALTITTNELPQIVAGVPTDLREVDAIIEKPEFMINPTNCNPQEFTGTAYGTPPPGVGGPGEQTAISSHFQVGSCRSLEFKPKFSVSTSGKTSKALGASLTTKVTEPNTPQGTQADIAEVKVELPKLLPSRLTTLQKACTDAQFEANPAGCPSESKIGYAVVHTPLIPVPLQGPAIFVSHGDEAFPSLTLVLQGYGLTIDLVGATQIKNGVTSTTFKTVPDQPFSTFELTLPEGRFSALAANGNLCALTKTVTVNKKELKRVRGKLKKVTVKVEKTESESLVMPNEFVGQNGAVIKQSTKIGVTGCPKAKPAEKITRKRKARGK